MKDPFSIHRYGIVPGRRPGFRLLVGPCPKVLAALFLCGAAKTDLAAGPPDVVTLLAHAKPGKTVTLPDGTYPAGDLVVPAGVTLRGAGYLKTVIDASGHKAGLILAGKGSGAEDLTIRGAGAVVHDQQVLEPPAGDIGQE